MPLEFLLKKGGHEVVLARTGEEALRALEEGGIALVVLDLMLPGLDGFAVLEALREKPSRPKVLVLTARDREADRAKALALGAEAFMAKPFSTRALMDEVQRLLGEG